MGMVSPEALLPLVSIVLTFLDLVLIVARRRKFLSVPGVCESFGHLTLYSLSRLVPLLRGSHLAIRRFLCHFTSFHVDSGGTPSFQ
ncbi:hypothetical protein F5141DRAFT_1148693 [Pisolithus sp. B1]|nr:hypothetical protein F5141DRAFT_1148693 [Pisolithus sp. B1]